MRIDLDFDGDGKVSFADYCNSFNQLIRFLSIFAENQQIKVADFSTQVKGKMFKVIPDHFSKEFEEEKRPKRQKKKFEKPAPLTNSQVAEIKAWLTAFKWLAFWGILEMNPTTS